jgi:hypothetical protein
VFFFIEHIGLHIKVGRPLPVFPLGNKLFSYFENILLFLKDLVYC